MKIIIKARNIELTDDLKNLVENKFSSLKKFINLLKKEDEIGKTLAEVFVELEKLTRHHKKGKIFRVKTRICLPGRVLVAKETEDDFLKAITKVKRQLKCEIEKYQFRMVKKSKNHKL